MFSSDYLPNELPSAAARKARREEEQRSHGGRSIVDPLYVFYRLWNSKTLIVAMTLLGIVLAVLYALAQPKLYEATTQILVDPRELNVVQNEVTPNGLPSEATLALIESQVSVIYSNSLLTRVIDAADLTEDPEFNGTAVSGLAAMFPALASLVAGAEEEATARGRLLMTIRGLRNRLSVSREAKSFVLEISVESRDANKAARLSRLVSQTFIDDLGRVQSETARRATSELSSRLEELREGVVAAERNAEAYKAENALVGVGGRLIDDAYILQINEQLADVRGEITALRVRADSMRDASVDDVVAGTFPEELNSQALVRARSVYADLAQQAAVLRTQLGSRHPQRIASEQALDTARDAIEIELGRIVAGAQTELQRAVQTESNLSEQIDALTTKQITTSGAFVKLRELEREVEASRAVYEAFLLRARETGEQESLNTSNVRVISEAMPPLEPSSMPRRTIVLVGAILGFLAGVALAAAFAILPLIRDAVREPREWGYERTGMQLATGHFATSWSPDAQFSLGLGYGLGLSSAVAGFQPRLPDGGDDWRRLLALHPDEAAAPAAPRDEAPQGTAAAPDVSEDTPRAAPPAAASEESAALRQEIRMIAERRRASDGEAAVAETDPNRLKLRRDIETVKEAIADLRRRRTDHIGQAATS